MVFALTLNLLTFQGFNNLISYNILLFYLINNGLQNGIFNIIMPILTDFGSLLAWGILCGLLYLFGGTRAKKIAILGLLALFISNVIVFVLKYIIAEPRPFLVLGNVHQLIPETEIYSFPSGHTTSSFAAAIVIGLKYSLQLKNKKIRLIYPLIAFATLIGFSRIYIGVHYPFDVIFGALMGMICALIILKTEKQIFENKYLRKMGLEKIVEVSIVDKITKLGK